MEFVQLQLYGHEAVQPAMKKEQVEREVAPADLHRVFRSDETKVASQFNDEWAEIAEQTAVEIGLGVIRRKAEELEEVGVFEKLRGLWMQFSQHC